MCGRFTLTVNEKELNDYIKYHYQIELKTPHKPRYNIAPTQDVITVVHDGTHYLAETLKW